MELPGNEKRIQALFSELVVEDRTRVPDFEQSWKRAESTRSVKMPSFSRPVAVFAVIMVVAGTISLSIWVWTNATENLLVIAPQQIPSVALSQPPQLVSVQKTRVERRRVFLRKRESERKLITDAELLSRWQSPTFGLMDLSTGVALDSLPQLNQSAKDLESFLPKNK